MSPVKLGRLEAGVRVVLEFNDAFNRHDVAGMLRLMTPDCVFENTTPPPDGQRIAGLAEQEVFWNDFFDRAPDAHIEIEEIFGLLERCVMRWRYTWDAESGATGHVRGVDVYRVRGGLIFEKLSYVKG